MKAIIINKHYSFKEKLKKKMHEYVKFIYKISKQFPKEELYGSCSQIRRSALSIILNYIEGFARRRPAVQLNILFILLMIKNGSLKKNTMRVSCIQMKSEQCFGQRFVI